MLIEMYIKTIAEIVMGQGPSTSNLPTTIASSSIVSKWTTSLKMQDVSKVLGICKGHVRDMYGTCK